MCLNLNLNLNLNLSSSSRWRSVLLRQDGRLLLELRQLRCVHPLRQLLRVLLQVRHRPVLGPGPHYLQLAGARSRRSQERLPMKRRRVFTKSRVLRRDCTRLCGVDRGCALTLIRRNKYRQFRWNRERWRCLAHLYPVR